ncbi:tyrosine-type recombinase/integrase [Edaphobacter modestus]|uniref:Site-specific recombinase XerD n=1 Tax=Edaphobacter modestus TaxID=388466 RepID=A0A4Q7YNK6_9BACT|nr:site-specific integrase [Edaphobacter modestus]RZU39342.1 site-specific recombinase XerD [Edaphobacter modestus]
MANKAVTLHRRVKTPDGWKRYPAAMSPNGRVKPNTVKVGDIEVSYPVGSYELRSFEGKKTVWKRIEGGPSEALAALKLAQQRSAAVAQAKEAGVQVVIDQTRRTIRSEVSEFVQAAKDRGSLEAAELYGRSMEEFTNAVTKTYLDELDHSDTVKFHASMRRSGRSARTISNRHGHYRAFLKFAKFTAEEIKDLAGQKPRYEKTLPEVYEPDQLTKFFASLTEEYDQLLFDVLLQTGLREQEASHVEWIDISVAHSTLMVRSKPRWSFAVKDAEEREIPISKQLLDRLTHYRQSRQATHPKHTLIFGRKNGADNIPDGHLLRKLKFLARDAGLNCGECATCRNQKVCERWFLHKFRASFITKLLRNGMDLRTVMKLSGHSDIESVMRYLRPAEGKEVQDRVNAIAWR